MSVSLSLSKRFRTLTRRGAINALLLLQMLPSGQLPPNRMAPDRRTCGDVKASMTEVEGVGGCPCPPEARLQSVSTDSAFSPPLRHRVARHQGRHDEQALTLAPVTRDVIENKINLHTCFRVVSKRAHVRADTRSLLSLSLSPLSLSLTHTHHIHTHTGARTQTGV